MLEQVYADCRPCRTGALTSSSLPPPRQQVPHRVSHDRSQGVWQQRLRKGAMTELETRFPALPSLVVGRREVPLSEFPFASPRHWFGRR